jgi:hypothetical protein
MLFKRCIGFACIARYNTLYSLQRIQLDLQRIQLDLQRIQLENPDETDLLKELFDIFEDDIINTVWTNSVYFIEWSHHTILIGIG